MTWRDFAVLCVQCVVAAALGLAAMALMEECVDRHRIQSIEMLINDTDVR